MKVCFHLITDLHKDEVFEMLRYPDSYLDLKL
jgi:hypothetical protein